MTREELEKAIKCCNPYDEDCGNCPFHNLPLGKCFESLAKSAFNMLLEDREKLQKQVKEYQDKIEQGRLIELPCKVGDTVYIACDWDINEVVEGVVSDIEYTVNARGFCYRIYVDHKYIFSKTNPNVVKHRYIFMRKEIFLTREEAERKLKELQNG